MKSEDDGGGGDGDARAAAAACLVVSLFFGCCWGYHRCCCCRTLVVAGGVSEKCSVNYTSRAVSATSCVPVIDGMDDRTVASVFIRYFMEFAFLMSDGTVMGGHGMCHYHL